MEDLYAQLKVTQANLDTKGNSDAVMRMLIQQKKDIKYKIDNPVSEIKTDIETVRNDMEDMFKKVGDSCDKFKGDISVIKYRIEETFLLVADARYKVGNI